MERAFQAASAHSSRFVFLIASFVDRRIDAGEFSKQFRVLQQTETPFLDSQVASVVRMLSVDVSAYSGDTDTRGIDYIGAEQLWQAAGAAFQDLMELQSQLVEREAG